MEMALQAYLPWDRDSREEQLFHTVLWRSLLAALLLGLLWPLLPSEPPQREEIERVPQRLAHLVLERRQTPPPPAAAPEREEAPPPELKAEEKKPEVKEESAARKKARGSGLLAFADQLQALSGGKAMDKVTRGEQLNRGGARSRLTSTALESGAGRGSGGIDTDSMSRDSGSGGQLAEREASRVVVAEKDEPLAKQQTEQKKQRSDESIRLVFDRYRGAIFAIYNRALRSNPLLAGKLVLEVTIAPSGEVTACRVLSSELGDSELEQKLVTRVKMFNFGARDVPAITVTYPIDFLPS